jgi:hypothetical protein
MAKESQVAIELTENGAYLLVGGLRVARRVPPEERSGLTWIILEPGYEVAGDPALGEDIFVKYDPPKSQ